MRWGAVVVLLMAAGCVTPQAEVDPLSADLLAEYDLRPIGRTTTQETEVGDPAEQPWSLYAEASRAIGLGNAWDRGSTAQVRTTPIEGAVEGIRGHVLVQAGRIIGAWLSHPDAAPGIYALNAPP